MTIKSLTAGSWATKSAGVASIVSALLSIYLNRNNAGLGNESSVIATATAQIVAGIGLLLARQNNKTSEDVGAGPAGQMAELAKQQASLDAKKAALTKPAPTPPAA